MIHMLPISPPVPNELRLIREGLGLSQPELAGVLGFSPLNGHKTIRDWEHGTRDGEPFAPTPTAWAALRYLVMVVELYGELPSGQQKAKIASLLPDVLR